MHWNRSSLLPVNIGESLPIEYRPGRPLPGNRMRVLILSWYFPPANLIGAIRVGKLARYLHEQGHDVRVLTSDHAEGDRSLPLEIPPANVLRTPWFDIDRVAHPLTQRRRKPGNGYPAPHGQETAGANRLIGRLRGWLAPHYNALFQIPDRRIGWLPYALSAARKLARQWRPDLIYASAPPYTTLLAAHLISRRHNVPWVAEYRDRWVDDPYLKLPQWRLRLDRYLQRRLMATATGIVTVSEPWAAQYRDRFGLPLATIYNGFDPKDFPETDTPEKASPGPLHIVHTGALYGGRRDPRPLFQAIKASGLAPKDLCVDFYGPDSEVAGQLADAARVADFVNIFPPVPYSRSVELQKEADVLLLMQSNDPLEQGNVPAKIFEYFAVRRPILGLGLEDGVPAKLIAESQAGLFCNDPAVIERQLAEWVATKRRLGLLPRLPATVRARFSREDQFRRLVEFLDRLLLGRAAGDSGRAGN